MKVSEFLRAYQLTGELPQTGDDQIAFWAGWLIGNGTRGQVARKIEEALEMAIKAAEFIESRAR